MSKELPETLEGHWMTPDGAAMAREYADRPRNRLMGGHMTDMEVAFGTAMLDRYALDHEAQLLVAKDRIRWLSVQLALANMPRGRMEPVDLGYCLFCAVRCVGRDPLAWLRADKEPWIKAAQEFMRMAELKP